MLQGLFLSSSTHTQSLYHRSVSRHPKIQSLSFVQQISSKFSLFAVSDHAFFKIHAKQFEHIIRTKLLDGHTHERQLPRYKSHNFKYSGMISFNCIYKKNKFFSFLSWIYCVSLHNLPYYQPTTSRHLPYIIHETIRKNYNIPQPSIKSAYFKLGKARTSQ